MQKTGTGLEDHLEFDLVGVIISGEPFEQCWIEAFRLAGENDFAPASRDHGAFNVALQLVRKLRENLPALLVIGSVESDRSENDSWETGIRESRIAVRRS